jgi:ABC-type oligopeptide transport system substrate-binding subunit
MRNIYYARAESILVRELPLIPLYYEFEHFVKNENLVIDLNTPHIDFKWLSIKNIPKKGGSYASNS